MHLVRFGAALLIAAVVPAAGRADDAALEKACRATEVAVPDSCGCTIAAARKAGIDDATLASLFRDDGRTRPVDQASYGRFWQVKIKCVANVTMAGLKRPALPTPPTPPAAPAATAAPRPAPAAGSRAAAPDHLPMPGWSGGVPPVSSDRTLTLGGDARLRFGYAWPRSWATIDGLAAQLSGDRKAELAKATGIGREFSPTSYLDKAEYLVIWDEGETVGPLLFTTKNIFENLGGAHPNSSAEGRIWDRSAARWIDPIALFEPAFANGPLRRRYCAALDAERRERRGGASGGDDRCPAWKDLAIAIDHDARGTPALEILADRYVAGSYAEGWYEILIPWTAEMIAGVKPPYRAAMAQWAGVETASAGAMPARSSADPMQRITLIGPKNPWFVANADCTTDWYRLAPGTPAPRDYAGVRALAGRQKGSIAATWGELGNEASFRTGMVIDGAFVTLTDANDARGETAVRQTLSGSGVELRFDFGPILHENAGYGGRFGTGTLTIDGQTSSFPALVESIC